MQYSVNEKTYIGLSVIGILISIYLTISHYYSAIPVVCPTVGIVDCGTVLNSSFSVVFGVIPSSALGIAFFLVMLYFIMAKNREDAFYWNLLGFVFLFYFWYAEFSLGKICLYCSAIHLIVVVMLAMMLLERKAKK